MCSMRIAFNHFLNISHKILNNHSFYKLLGAQRLVKYVRALPAIIKSINPMQKYSKSIFKIFATTVDLSITILISLEYVQIQNHQNK